mgnify:CR=1 FL=1|jgi:L-threonylcarbamoyladenylate synthase
MTKVSCDYNGLRITLESIRNGGVVIFPTDTVYGIGCDPYNKEAVDRVYTIKKRNKTKGVPILGYSKDDLEKIVVFNEITKKIAKKFWPGQLTIVLPLKDKKLKESMCVTDKIAVRVPDNKCILSLLKQCKLIIGTSANLSTKNSFVEPELCAKSITGYDIFLDGGTLESLGESTIIEIVNKEIKILRKGVISQEELFSLV